MKIVLFAGIAAIVAGGVYLHGPLRDGETYDRSIDEAYESVRNMPMPKTFSRIVDRVPGGSIRRDFVDRQSITWTFMAKGKEGSVFKVEFTPVETPGQVYVSTSYTALDHANLLYDGSDPLMGDPDLFDKLARVALREQVDSRLERRPYNNKPAADVMAAWTVKNINKIQQGVAQQMNEVSQTFSEMDEQTRQMKSAAEARKFSSGKPMNDAKPMSSGR